MSRKTKLNIFVNCIGALITFALVSAIFLQYDNTKGSSIYHRLSGSGFDTKTYKNAEFIKTVDFSITGSEETEIFSGENDYNGFVFSLVESSDYVMYQLCVTNTDGVAEADGVGAYRENSYSYYEICKGANIRFTVSIPDDSFIDRTTTAATVTGKYDIYYLK